MSPKLWDNTFKLIHIKTNLQLNPLWNEALTQIFFK